MSDVIEVSSNTPVKLGSDRSFGVVFSVVFTAVALWPLLNGGAIRPLFLAAGIAFLVIAYSVPRILHVPNKLWFKLGLALGAIMAPVAMAVVYTAVFLPMGMAMRIAGKDLLKTRAEPEAQTYWIERKEKPQPMSRQF